LSRQDRAQEIFDNEGVHNYEENTKHNNISFLGGDSYIKHYFNRVYSFISTTYRRAVVYIRSKR
jgi:Ca2+-binding RTX toxin-like protein